MRTRPPVPKGNKYCSKCKTIKAFDCFGKNKSLPDGLTYWCKECLSEYMDKTREHRLAYHKNHYRENREYYIKKAIEISIANPEKRREYCRKSYKKWSKANPDKIREIDRRKRSTAKGKVSDNISRAIRKSLGNGNKRGHHWEDLVGYTVDQLKRHLNKQFKPGMTWDNFGSYWNIDHKIPVAVFNFKTFTDIDFKRCWALNNLQPMEAKSNFRKGATLNNPFQPALTI